MNFFQNSAKIKVSDLVASKIFMRCKQNLKLKKNEGYRILTFASVFFESTVILTVSTDQRRLTNRCGEGNRKGAISDGRMNEYASAPLPCATVEEATNVLIIPDRLIDTSEGMQTVQLGRKRRAAQGEKRIPFGALFFFFTLPAVRPDVRLAPVIEGQLIRPPARRHGPAQSRTLVVLTISHPRHQSCKRNTK